MSKPRSIELLESPWNREGDVFAAVTLRSLSNGEANASYAGANFACHVGDSVEAVAENREALQAFLGGGLTWHWLDQVHGTRVYDVDASTQEPIADAATTASHSQVCAVLTADCLPVFFYSPNEGRVAVAHAGWRGLSQGVLEATLASFKSRSSDVRVWFGPAIGRCHFEVGEEVELAFLNAAKTDELKTKISAAFEHNSKPGKAQADLYALARDRLQALGVIDIEGGDLCTFCEPQRFYSYRRDSVCGRMLSLIYIK